MYFETGQGSELTYNKHEGIDMTTTEALCYGLARRYKPFMVNNVTGFIGPETHLDNHEMIYSCLQDHFMGKLLGLPMGMAPCYTLHSQVTLEGQQMATELLTAAGANFLGFGRSFGLGLSQGAFTLPPALKAILLPIMSAVPFVESEGFPGRFALVVFHWTRHAGHSRTETVAPASRFGALCCLLGRDRRL
jgi:hypothetical protein